MALESMNMRKWDELIPDTLGIIFKNLSLLEMLTVVPCVCKSWKSVILGPYCWQEIDIDDWSRNAKPDVVDRMLRLLVGRSSRSLRKLSVTGLTDDQSLKCIAINAQSLEALRLPRCNFDDSVMLNTAKMFASITLLDLGYCLKIGAPALEAIGKNCKSLSTLLRVMHPLESINKSSQADEAVAIANNFPQLKHLELSYTLINTAHAMEIIRRCEKLEHINLHGCWEVHLKRDFVKLFPKLKVIGPLVVDCFEPTGWENSSEYSGSSDYLSWTFHADEIEDELEAFSDMFSEYGDDVEYVDDEDGPIVDAQTQIIFHMNAGNDLAPRSP